MSNDTDDPKDPDATPPEDYKVGDNPPPTANQFQKGKSGNPMGRPKKMKSGKPRIPPGDILDAVLNEEIPIAIQGEKARMTALEAIFLQLRNNALLGDKEALRELRQYCFLKPVEVEKPVGGVLVVPRK